MDIAQIAEKLEGGGRDVLASLLADPVEIRHVPPLVHDGAIPRDSVLKGVEGEDAAFRAGIANFRRTIRTEVNGNVIRSRSRIQGTLGVDTVDLQLPIDYTVKNGQIVSMIVEINDDARAVLGAALKAGGFAPPTTPS